MLEGVQCSVPTASPTGVHEAGVTGTFQRLPQRQLSKETEGGRDVEATTRVSGWETSPLSFESTRIDLPRDRPAEGSLSSYPYVGSDPLLPLF